MSPSPAALLFVSVALATGPGLAHASDDAVEETGVQAAVAVDQIFDEIVVIGDMTPRRFRLQIERAEDEVFSIFNELNGDDDYDIVCKRRTRVGSQIPFRSCKARLYWEALSEAAQEGDFGAPYRERLSNASAHAARLREIMAETAGQDPQLMRALQERHQLQLAYDVWIQQRETGASESNDD